MAKDLMTALMILLITFSGSVAIAQEKIDDIRLSENECNPAMESILCYGKESQSILDATLSKAIECEQGFGDCIASVNELQASLEPKWYANQWIWLSVGLVVGGSTVLIAHQ